jgi:3-hydroxyisobutyrate dehydrogenase-like beta-hydroxyacid dehydrogenase
MDVNLMCKDMRAMLAEAHSLGRQLPVTQRALEVFDEAAARGMADADAIKLPAYWLAQAKA